MELNFTRLSRMPEHELPAAPVLEALLNELSSIPGLEAVGENMRSSRFTTRRPNVPLAALDEDAVRRGIRAVGILRG